MDRHANQLDVESRLSDNGAEPFLSAAVRHGFLESSQLGEVEQYAKNQQLQVPDAVLSLSVLTLSQIEAITLLQRPSDLVPGFELSSLIGCGAGGLVFKARQSALERNVAIKTIGAGYENAISNGPCRMRREALAIAKLRHPNIVSVYDSGLYQGQFCIAMEFVEGGNLSDRIENQGPLSEQEAWQVARQVAAALKHANDQGIIHRDIKPANILLCESPAGVQLPNGVPFIKVADFGLAFERENDRDTRLTASGTGLGTPAYVAPEQIDDSQVDMQADIYALGATVFHMLTGEAPYADLSPVKAIVQKTIGDDTWRNHLPEGTSAASERLFRDLTESKVSDRLDDYDELIRRIDDVLNTASETPRQVARPKSVPTSVTRTVADTVGGRTRFAWATSLAMIVALVLGYGGYRGLSDDDISHESPIALASWQPNGLPQPLFNGQSVPRLDKSGIWQPTIGADGSRVLTGAESSTINLPLSIDGADHVRLRFSVNLKTEAAIEMAILQDGMQLPSLNLRDGQAKILEANNVRAFQHTIALSPAGDQDVVFQRVELTRSNDVVAIVVNGEYLGDVKCTRNELEVTIRCLEGNPDLADIDIVGLVASETT